jgi:hypothetical protein
MHMTPLSFYPWDIPTKVATQNVYEHKEICEIWGFQGGEDGGVLLLGFGVV